MNRRRAIGRIILATLGGGLAFSGYEWYRYEGPPDYAFADRHDDLITALADAIIPHTADSPGALEAGVTPFILKMVRECMTRPTANNFIRGLKDIDDWCIQKYNNPFQHCRDNEKSAALAHFEEKDRLLKGIGGKIQRKLLGDPFFLSIKRCTAIAYCTSETGATKGLAYVLVPGSYHGCIPFSPGQKAWATF
ncbi:MAG TPA: gluconate 2-dehydrogenase subunit 3 family protein [Puia sp.]|jgi:hypothetical protein|uniref:gluconate 2-dehydrogenase subunit 3 family protein n=1 Tax=Puia sp. TaxID=2045100 RepID=UPI002B562F5B|nr:gluconate 2-dehydrogenase subunit 3 family protein [Puia sp.]HVU95085.1 gluconate 2-dehydrogenase subunit 3 family protein [Puia sp.]